MYCLHSVELDGFEVVTLSWCIQVQRVSKHLSMQNVQLLKMTKMQQVMMHFSIMQGSVLLMFRTYKLYKKTTPHTLL